MSDALPIRRDDDPQDTRWARLESYVATIQGIMGLALRRVIVSRESPEECGPPDPSSDAGIAAVCSNSYSTLTTMIRFGDDFFTVTPEDQRVIVVHELIHTVNVPRTRVVESLESSGALGSREYSLWKMMFDYGDEEVTDHLARVISPFLPLPDLGDWRAETGEE